jgi:uncharacterized repeat protein (TIGR03843 family)
MPYSSNATFLVQVAMNSAKVQAIYKPRRGERSLWDFPGGLFMREVAAFELSRTLGWDLIPLTVYRSDGPFGDGSLQLFVEADLEQHYFTLFEAPELHPQFKKFAVFDIIANNADRKSGHLLIDNDDHIWGIDQGLCFHCDPKLRTVIWEFAGKPIPGELLEELEEKRDSCTETLARFLDREEVSAFEERVSQVLKARRFPVPNPDMRCYPWPLI